MSEGRHTINTDSNNTVSRRTFLKAGATASAATLMGSAPKAFARGSDTMRIALIGCGSRGTDAAKNCLSSSSGVELVAMADMFPDRMNASLAALRKEFPQKIKVGPETRFFGFDAHQKVIALDNVDIVLLCTPPGFRPQMVRAAVEGGKHIFMEKPGAVDPTGVRSLMDSAGMADKQGLSIVVGTQQRWQPHYREIIKRIQDGQLGQIVGGQAYWHWGHAHWHFEKRKPEWSDMEWQIRCWPYFTWLSGDHVVEQHLHNMDILNWAIGSHPVSCMGFGGRQARTGPEYGNIFDHFSVEYEYPGGIRVTSSCSQIEGSSSRVGERVVGSKGWTFTTRANGKIEGENAFSYEKKIVSGLVEEHAGLIKSIRNNQPINECRRLAETTMTMIIGRMSAYTGRQLKWNWAMRSSKLDLSLARYAMGDLPVGPVAIPGKTKLS
ncbi:MAG: Gfo/Idh/MocA family oxidoreductase [Planctomycetes bacterium]|nr:Gfo/Idh/MocA family oxidoreductase [Planctomycetota bacterium]